MALSANAGVHMPFVSSAAFQCAMKALQEAECVVSQPVMQVEVTTGKEYVSRVSGELQRRMCVDVRMSGGDDDEKELLGAEHEQVSLSSSVPLAKLTGLASDLRRLTSGNATFTIEFKSYEVISQREYQDLLDKRNKF